MHGQLVESARVRACVALSGAPVPDTALEPLTAYLQMLCHWNTAMNLVGFRTWQDILTRLVLDSFHLAVFLDDLVLPASPVSWDLGAGAGLPGIPLRMVWTRGVYHMVEAREKRALFLSSVLARLHLPTTYVYRGTAEDFFSKQKRQADIIVSRAFKPWQQLLPFVADHMSAAGTLVVLAREPAPPDVPEPWRVAKHGSYAAADAQRHFWALTRNDMTGPSLRAAKRLERCCRCP